MTKQEAIDYFGSATKLAEALDVSPAAVSLWRTKVPPLRQIQLERITRGKLKAGANVFSTKVRQAA